MTSHASLHRAEKPYDTVSNNQIMDERKRIVERGYDAVSQRYSAWAQQEPYPRMQFVGKLLECLASGSKVLELGCGSGRPVAQALAERFHLTAVDISTAQLNLARVNDGRKLTTFHRLKIDHPLSK